MSYSTTDELEAIERAARGGPSGSTSESAVPQLSKERKKNLAEQTEPRRGSSMFASGGIAGPSKGASGGKKYGDDLLVDFPHSDDEDEDFEDSDDEPVGKTSARGMKRGIDEFDGEHRDGRRELPGAPMPGSSGSRPFKEKCEQEPATGSQNHRPMVGGFAAAAYEAAREYHYQSKARQQQQQSIPKRTGPPPSI